MALKKVTREQFEIEVKVITSPRTVVHHRL